MIKRLKRRYKNVWLHCTLPGVDLYRDDHRAIAEQAFDEVWFSQWYPVYLCVILTLIYGAGMTIFMVAMAAAEVGVMSLSFILVGLILGALVLLAVSIGADLLFMFLLRPFLQRKMRRALRRRGHDVCIECGYLLRGVPEDSIECPECGSIRERTELR